ncbi:gas vesicle protein GvpO [Halegenticoccus soli]|uniref:gas vesicle protein GvpO n=1 Tax=Halegenticoccus soli TaxID=1985678 RepID=UPI0013043666|nr:gas vesicle protein GvpO [Halegenticoccus soli]
MAESTSDAEPEREQSLGETRERLTDALEGARGGAKPADVRAVREAVRDTAEKILRRPVDGIVEVSPGDGGWTVGVEVIERRSVPDTQDILGRYDLRVDESGSVDEFRRVERYRRSEFDRRKREPT